MEVFHLWPENAQAWQLFHACDTQWRTSMAGREGLDYTGVRIVIAAHGVPRRKRDQRFIEVQVLERAALKVWSEQAEKNS